MRRPWQLATVSQNPRQESDAVGMRLTAPQMLFGLGVGRGYSAEPGSLVVVVDTSDCGGGVAFACGASASAGASPLRGENEYGCCSAGTSTAG